MQGSPEAGVIGSCLTTNYSTDTNNRCDTPETVLIDGEECAICGCGPHVLVDVDVSRRPRTDRYECVVCRSPLDLFGAPRGADQEEVEEAVEEVETA